jgi:ABC-2 type transport system permease protein
VIRLVRVELRRLSSRRLLRWGLAVALLGVLAAPLITPWAFGEQARIQHDADIERCVEAKNPKVRDGVIMPTISPTVAEPAVRERLCRQVTPELDPLFHLRELDEVLRTVAALLIIAGFLVGASSVGADWQTGVMATVLTWESRRLRVVAARLLALVLAVFGAAFVWQVLVGSSLVPYSLLRDTSDSTGWEWLRTTSGLGARIALVAAGTAAVGFALALAGRATAVALGAGFAYLFVFENVIGSQFKPIRPWLMLWNAVVFVKGRFAAGGDVPGRSVAAAAAVLAVYLAVVTAAAALVFQRRDV